MKAEVKINYHFHEFTRKELMALAPEVLAGVLRERVHHNVEVPLYPVLRRWKGKPIATFGNQAQLVFDVWRARGLPEDTPDIEWAKRYLAIAAKIRAGERPELSAPLPQPFTPAEMAAVRKLIFERRSIRDWIDKPVPEEMIQQILEAGNAAPIGCNLGHLRFVVLTDPDEKKMIWSDIKTIDVPVIIVICHDTRITRAVGQATCVPQNPGFDAAAAGDHMLLMAHALGLGGVWLSEMKKTELTEDTGEAFRQRYGLPDHFEVDLHIAVGWTAIGSIKSARPALRDVVIRRQPRTAS